MISIVVPVYNGAQYLSKCIDSLIAQNADSEIIIINDCSTDESLDILIDYSQKYPFIVVYTNDKNRGLSFCRNLGIDLAQGDFIMFVDCDDWIEDNAINDIYELTKNNCADIIIGKINGVPEKSISKVYKDPSTALYIDSKNIGRSLIAMHNQHFKIAPCVKYIVSKKYIEQNKFRFLDILYEDEIWSVQILINAFRITTYNCFFYNYRLHNQGLSSLRTANVFDDHLKLISHLLALMRNTQESPLKEFILLRIEHIINALKGKIVLSERNKANIIGVINGYSDALGACNIARIMADLR